MALHTRSKTGRVYTVLIDHFSIITYNLFDMKYK